MPETQSVVGSRSLSGLDTARFLHTSLPGRLAVVGQDRRTKG